MKIYITPKTKVDVRLSISMAELTALLPITQSGLPDEIPREMRSAISALVNLAVNPLRPTLECLSWEDQQ